MLGGCPLCKSRINSHDTSGAKTLETLTNSSVTCPPDKGQPSMTRASSKLELVGWPYRSLPSWDLNRIKRVQCWGKKARELHTGEYIARFWMCFWERKAVLVLDHIIFGTEHRQQEGFWWTGNGVVGTQMNCTPSWKLLRVCPLITLLTESWILWDCLLGC